MTISTTTILNSYSGNGSTTAFAYTFPINTTSEITVIERSATGVETVKAEGTGSTNYGIADTGASGGTVTMVTAPAAGTTLLIRRNTEFTQETDYVANDPFPAETHEDALDKLQMQNQELEEELNRSIKISRTNTMTSTEFTTSASDRASKVLAFDSSGELSVTQELGTFKGNSATTTTAAFVQRDIVKGTTTAQLNNIYICVADSAIGDALTDTDHFALIVDAVSAATSATTATTKATAAASSATAAAASETAAETAETNAETAETNAAASFDSFDDRYLGAKSSAPTVDNDGDALITGALYFNSSTSQIFNWTAADAWEAIKPTSDQQTAINALAASAVIADMAILATDAIVADMAILATDAIVADMAILGTSAIVADMAILGTDDVVADMNVLASTATVTDMDILGTSANVTAMGLLGTAAVVEDLGILGTSAVVSDMATLAGSGNAPNVTTVTASGVITGGTVEATTDTAAGDNAAMGYTSAEGLILTGQGTTNDVTIKNDADADVIEIPTGTVNVTMAGTLGVVGEIAAASLDISGNVDVDGTLETDALSIASTAVSSTAAEINLLDAVARGKIIYGNASGASALLAPGSNGKVLTSDGTDISWETNPAAAIDGTANGADNRIATYTSGTALNGEANLTFDGTNLKVGAAATPGGKLAITTADSNASAHADADELVMETNGAAGLSILSFNNNYGNIYFGDDGDNDIGKVTYLHTDNSMSFTTNTAVGLKIDGAGHVTKPLQPAVHAVPNAAQNDMANGIVTIVLGAEVYDTNSDFNVSNSTFTAPVTGKYLVACNVDLSDIDTATQWLYGNLLVSSNRNYYMNTSDPRKDASADYSKSFNGTAIVDMDANDTLLLKIRSSAHGAAQMNVVYGGGETWLTISLLQ